MDAAAVGSSANINLTNVVGSGSGAANVTVSQTAAAANAVANLTVNGGTYYTSGISVTQASSGAHLDLTVTAAADGYHTNVHQ